MIPVLRVIKYLFKKQNKDDIEDDIKSFFNKGINFPQFVALAFNIEKVPGFKPDPKLLMQKVSNNHKAYKYLIENNSEIRKISPEYNTESDRKVLLSLILTKQIYNINYQKTLVIINHIVKPLGIIFKNKSDILTTKCLLSLLNVLSDGKVPIESQFDDFDDILIEGFEKAQAPLVIDESCLELQNQYLFFIQIEILFEFYSEKIKEITIDLPNELPNQNFSQNNEIVSPDINNKINITLNLDDFIKERKVKKKEINKIEYEKDDDILHEISKDKVILDTINEIGKNCNLYFENFNDAIENDNLPKFVLYLLKNDQTVEKFLNDLIDKQGLPNVIKIEIVIELLKILEPKFGILSFDFENPNYIESSSILLYTNLLDFFFLKKSKDELYDRCYTLLYGKYKKGDFMYKSYHKKIEILRDWNTYNTLISFINNKECKFKFDLADHFDQMFNSNSSRKVPNIITESYLESFSPKIIPEAAYYQLQFIFDSLDSGDFKHRLVEYFLITIRKFSQIEVPSTEKIAMSIRTKYLSLILQNKIYKKNLKLQIANVGIDDNQNIKSNEFNIQKCRLYKDRRSEFTQENLFIIKSLQLNALESIDDFYNSIENKASCEKGILYKENLLKNWESVMKNLVNHEIADVQKEHKINSGQFSDLFKKKETVSLLPEQKLPIYKLFYFNLKTDEWIFNHDQLEQLYNDRIVNDEIQKIPLILFLETNIDVILYILKTLNNLNFEDTILKEKDICIFGVCNKQINDLRFDKKPLYDEKQGKAKPIFLFLHVPDRKKRLEKIKRIFPQIFLFLSIISDVKLVCLDGCSCISQIDFINNLNRLISSYKINENEIEIFSKTIHNKEKDISNEEEEYEYEEQNDDNNKDINDMKKEFLNQVDPNLFNQKMNLFILIQDSHFCYSKPNDKIKDAELFKPFKSSDLINSEIYFFKSDKPDTYDFIDNLLKSSLHSKSDYNKIRSKFELINFFPMNRAYVDMNFYAELSDLEKIIHTRFLMLPSENKNNSNFFKCLKLIQEELFNSFPIFDNNFYLTYNKIISELKEKIVLNQRILLENELSFSSELHLSYLSDMINSKSFWEKDELDAIKKSHLHFLKEEFFAIVHDLAQENQFAEIFVDNNQVLENQILKDKDRTEAIFEIVEERMKLKMPRKVNAQKGTNYTIRERENEREVKVRIESGRKLEELIEQDF